MTDIYEKINRGSKDLDVCLEDIKEEYRIDLDDYDDQEKFKEQTYDKELTAFDDVYVKTEDIDGITEEEHYTDWDDPAAAGLPMDKSPSDEDRFREFQAEYASMIWRSITEDRILDVSRSLVDAESEEILEALQKEADAEQSEVIESIRQPTIRTAEDKYILDPTYYQNNETKLINDALEETLREELPTHELRDGVDKIYSGQELDPRAIQRYLVEQMVHDVGSTVTEHDAVAHALANRERLKADDSPDSLESYLPANVSGMESKLGERHIGVQWNTAHPSVQRAASERLQEAIGKEIQRSQSGASPASLDELGELQKEYKNAIQRFRVDETLGSFDRFWDTADMPYDVFEINNPEEMKRAAKDIGNCRRDAIGYYEELADDPYTTVLGVRRDDEDEWIGLARTFHMETEDNEDVLAIDNLGMQYESDHAGMPENCCDFENFGDALPVMGLASIAYGLENNFDYVVAGRSDKRVGGGPGDHIGVAQLYSTKNISEDELQMEKKGERDIERAFGMKKFTKSLSTQEFALLMENPTTH